MRSFEATSSAATRSNRSSGCRPRRRLPLEQDTGEAMHEKRLVVDAAALERVDLESDVVVVGSGAAGLSAALSAQSAGADVIVLEKAASLGGTTIKSSAWAWYPNHPGVRRDGHVDEKADALRYMA